MLYSTDTFEMLQDEETQKEAPAVFPEVELQLATAASRTAVLI